MSRIVIIHVCVFTLTFGAWEAIGPFGGPLADIAIAPSNEAVLYAASYKDPATVVKSTNGGADWIILDTLSNYIYDIAVDPTDPLIAYYTSYRCIFKTTNGGATWTTISLSNDYIQGIAVDPVSPLTVYAVGKTPYSTYTVMAFFKSTNGGTSWSTTPLHTVYNGGALCIALDPSSPSTIYVGGYYYCSPYNYPRVYKSTNGGTSFFDVSSGFSTGGTYVNALAVHPTDSNYVYATTFYDGIYRTTDGGGSWSMVMSQPLMSCIITTQASPTHVYAGRDTLIYKSTNSGSSWFVAGSGYGGTYKMSRSLAASHTQAGLVYTADNRGCFKTTNGGTSWFDSNYGMALANIASFSVAPSAAATVYTEFEEVCTFKTTDSGGHWAMLPATLECGSICEFAVDYTNPNRVLALEGLG
ncbi:hypothetical protein JXB22_00830 [candidate division WOR-3 bacterium]|nr:hypothetical protein [candidate division WOR-3 bacterium]